MKPIKVLVTGASGKMGREVLNAVCRDPGMEPVGAVDLKAAENFLSLPDGSGLIPYSSDLEALIIRSRPDVIVDFTTAEAVLPTARIAARNKVAMVVGTTGITDAILRELEQLSKSNEVGIMVAPNFALGAVLMMHMSQLAAKFFDYAEIIELHHEQKIDSPSGTALATAKAMREARGTTFTRNVPHKEPLPGARGGNEEGISVHSVRLPGLVAHQEVIFGGLGQTLTIRHDSISRESFMPGVLLAIKEVVQKPDFVVGLDRLLGL